MTALELLQLTPSEWQGVADKLTSSKMQDLSQILDAIAQRAALLGEYLDVRSYGMRDHEGAAKEAEKRLVRIRKAMGYTYSDRVGIRIPG